MLYSDMVEERCTGNWAVLWIRRTPRLGMERSPLTDHVRSDYPLAPDFADSPRHAKPCPRGQGVSETENVSTVLRTVAECSAVPQLQQGRMLFRNSRSQWTGVCPHAEGSSSFQTAGTRSFACQSAKCLTGPRLVYWTDITERLQPHNVRQVHLEEQTHAYRRYRPPTGDPI